MSVPEGKKSLPKIAFPAGVVVTLALAYLLDSWLFTQTRLARSEGTQNPLHLWTAVSGLVLFTAWLVLSWITLTRGQRSTPISVIVLIVGLFLYAYPSLVFVITWFTMMFFKVRTPLFYTGLFVAVLSVLNLLVTRPVKNENQSHFEY